MVAGPGHPCLGTVGYVPCRASKSALWSPLRHIIVELKCPCETSRLLRVYLRTVLATPRTGLPHALAPCEPRLLLRTV